MPAAGPPVNAVPVAEIVRYGFVEGHHYGSVVALAADGDRRRGRSATSTCRCCRARATSRSRRWAWCALGLDLPAELLALACASHSGEPFHLDGVRRILAGAGLTEADLQTPPDYPLDDDAREALIRAGGEQAPVLMNCSGKHAAMLATCVANGWPTDTYRDPDHPLQQAIAETFAELTGEPVAVVAVDGCGAPLLSASLVGLARAFRRLALGVDGSASPTRRGPRSPTRSAPTRRTSPGTTPRRAGAAHRHPGRDRQGRRRVLLRRRAARRPGVRAQDRRRRRPRAAGADGRGAAPRPACSTEDGVDAEAVRRTGVVELLGGGAPVGRDPGHASDDWPGWCSPASSCWPPVRLPARPAGPAAVAGGWPRCSGCVVNEPRGGRHPRPDLDRDHGLTGGDLAGVLAARRSPGLARRGALVTRLLGRGVGS